MVPKKRNQWVDFLFEGNFWDVAKEWKNENELGTVIELGSQ
jgi:hypothetical protein